MQCTLVHALNQTTTMALSKQQKINLQKLDVQTRIEILHECAGTLGLMRVCEYCEMTKEPRRTVYDQISNNRLESVDFMGQKLIIMNDK